MPGEQARCRFAVLAARLAGLAVALLPLAVAPALGSDRVEARYEIFGFAGLHVLTNRTSAEVTPSGYSIITNLGTRGVASAFVDLRSHSEVRGVLAGEQLRPEVYHAEVWRNGSDRDYAVRYLVDGNVINTANQPPPEGTYLDGAQLRGTVDQLTAYLLVERQLSRRGTCNLVVPVFDGNELYRLRFSDLKDETLTVDDYQNFAGATHVCQVVRDMIVANPNKKLGTYDDGRLWYARMLSDGRVLPVRMEYDTPFGSVHGYLGELTAGGVHLQLAGE